MSTTAADSGELERAVLCLREHPRAPALSGFAYAVLAGQAERRLAPAPASLLESAAKDFGIEREQAATSAGNVYTILESGPNTTLEASLVGACAVAGFGELCLAASSAERRSAAWTFVGHLSWAELATPYRITPFLGLVLPGEVRGLVEDSLLAAILSEDASTSVEQGDGAARARNAARITSLARAQSDAARSGMSRVRDLAKDPATRAVASALLGDLERSDAAQPLRVQGVAHAPARRLPWALLRWLTGIALLSALYRAVCFLLAMRREAEIELEGGLLRVRGRTTFLGRTVRTTEACYTLDRISGAFRRARFALLGSAVGVISLAIGILLGGHLLFDGARGGAPFLLVAGALTVMIGAALDLGLEILLPARAGQVEVQVDVLGARSVRVSRVPLPDADRLLSALAERVSLQT
ncbi:MAG TPA: hypothetical protein VJR89_16105 [Polyangiales bacterium]|nr:hypothetical protein [Polyangiales bacterium]